MSLLKTLAKVAVGIAVAKGVGGLMKKGSGGQQAPTGSGGGLGDLLGQLGGGAGGQGGDLLGKLGGSASGQAGGGLGDLLGQLGGQSTRGTGGAGTGDALGDIFGDFIGDGARQTQKTNLLVICLMRRLNARMSLL